MGPPRPGASLCEIDVAVRFDRIAPEYTTASHLGEAFDVTDPGCGSSESEVDGRQIAKATRALFLGMVVLTVVVQPVAAQSGGGNPVCGTEGMSTITNIVEGWVKLTAGLGLMAMVAVWQGDSLAEMFAKDPESRRKIKQHKRTIGKSGLTLVALGPGATLAGNLMNLPITQCVDLIPF